MNKQKVIKELEKYNYTFSEKSNQIIVKLDFSHLIIIDFSDANKIIISDKLVSWNFLTGSIGMSLKKAMIYNFIGIILTGFFAHYITNVMSLNLTNLFIMYGIWATIFTVYYSIKSENFKQCIISWTSE